MSWGMAESIEKYEEDEEESVMGHGHCVALRPRDRARVGEEVENRIEEALLSARRPRVQNFEDFEEATRALFRQLGASNASV